MTDPDLQPTRSPLRMTTQRMRELLAQRDANTKPSRRQCPLRPEVAGSTSWGEHPRPCDLKL